MAIQIPHNPLIQSVPMAEYANQFAQLKGNQQQNTLRQMQIDQAPQQLARQQRLDEQSAALNQANIDEKDTKGMAQKHAYAKQLATWMVSQAEKSGMQEGTPEFQQYLEKVGAPVRPMMAKMFGQSEMLTKPMDWNAIKTLAQGPDLSGTEQKDNYVFGYDAQGNPVRMNKANGLGGALIDERTGQPMTGSAQYSPQAIAARENAKQGQMGHVLDNSLYTGQQLNSAYGAPQAPQHPQVSTDFHTNPTHVDPSQYGTVEATPQEIQDYGYKIGGQPVVQPQRDMPKTLEQKAQLETETKANQERDKADIALQTEKAKTEQEQNNPVRVKARSDVSKLLNDLEINYADLDKTNSIHNDTKGTLSNLQAEINTSAPGLYASQAIGTKSKSVRNDIEAIRRTLMPAIMKATGMTGSQLNSDVELQNFMKQLTDPNTDIATVKSQINRLRGMYGDQSSAGSESSKGKKSTIHDEAEAILRGGN